MKFFYQIKIKENSEWADIWCDIEESNSKKELIEKLKIDYQAKIIEKESKKTDLSNVDFKVFATELTSQWEKHWLSERECKICQKKYTLLSCKQSQEYANYDNCSLVCNNQTRKSVNLDGYVTSYSQNNFKPCIYKITNKATGLCYIGQTTQCFTLRWYQHFFQSGESKFHEEIKRSKSTDWIFEVIEVLDQDKITKKELDQREMFWINFYDSINNGYNTAKFNL